MIAGARTAWVTGLLLVAFAVTPALAATLAEPLTLVLATGLAALGVGLLMRAGLISFGHGLFYAAGAYAVAYAARGGAIGDVVPLLLIAAVISGLLAWIVGLFIVRYRGVFFAMLNLALAMVEYTLLLKLYRLTGGSDGLPVAASTILGARLAPAGQELALFYLVLAAAVGAGWLVTRYLDAPPGWALGAISSSELRVEYLGVSTRQTLIVAYALAGVLTGLGGGIAALNIGHVVPDLAFWTTSSEFLFMAILGGSQSVPGPFVGAFVYEWMSLYGARYMATGWNLVLGVLILLILWLAPEGLWGLLRPAQRRRARARAAA
jgi:branched-chain amino acid transport system permease protein